MQALISISAVLARRPVYVPSEAKVTYTAGRVLPADPAGLALSNGALNKLLQGREGDGSPTFMSLEDAQEGFLMSECSMFIDAAYTEAQPAPKPARRWLQVSTQFFSTPAQNVAPAIVIISSSYKHPFCFRALGVRQKLMIHRKQVQRCLQLA